MTPGAGLLFRILQITIMLCFFFPMKILIITFVPITLISPINTYPPTLEKKDIVAATSLGAPKFSGVRTCGGL